eukprot:1292787-Amphidinium_carterae.1
MASHASGFTPFITHDAKLNHSEWITETHEWGHTASATQTASHMNVEMGRASRRTEMSIGSLL